ncbi:MAG TPA: hypothetical protein VGM39_24110 [Kofleriaceae bacterium]
MGSWVATIVDTQNRADFWDIARTHGIIASTTVVPPRALIDCDIDFEASTRLAEALSAQLQTLAVGLIMQTAADVHGIRAFDRGTLQRRIDYSRDEGGWRDLVGLPQLWEAALFFDGPADLSHWPDTLDDDISDEDIERYNAALALRDAASVMDLVHATGSGIHRVATALGVTPTKPDAQWHKPSLLTRIFGR